MFGTLLSAVILSSWIRFSIPFPGEHSVSVSRKVVPTVEARGRRLRAEAENKFWNDVVTSNAKIGNSPECEGIASPIFCPYDGDGSKLLTATLWRNSHMDGDVRKE